MICILMLGWHRYCGDQVDFNVPDLSDQRDESLKAIVAIFNRRCSVKTALSYNTMTPNEA